MEVTVRKRLGQEGLTLIEVLVAAVILAAGSVAVSSLIAAGLIRSDTNSAMTHATDLAIQEIEDLRSFDYTTLASRTAPNSPDVWNGTSFAIQSTVTRDAPAPNMSTISVAVTWSQRGQNYGYNLQTIYADTRA
jgi:prepilin-type N-terminal cleavage/methylation domain-containing protein